MIAELQELTLSDKSTVYNVILWPHERLTTENALIPCISLDAAIGFIDAFKDAFEKFTNEKLEILN